MAGFNPCAATGALADAQYDLIKRVNRKFEALRRLAILLEQLGDLTTLIPDINKLIQNLIPVNMIDFSVYNNLAQACPFLGLPAYGEAPLEELQRKVSEAYARMAGKIANSPYMRLGGLQNELERFVTNLDGYQDMFENYATQGAQYLECLTAMCQAGAQTYSLVGKVPSDELTVQLNKYRNNVITEGGSVLTAGGKQKYAEAKSAHDQLKGIGGDITSDYQTIVSTPSTVNTAATETPIETQSYSQLPFYQ